MTQTLPDGFISDRGSARAAEETAATPMTADSSGRDRGIELWTISPALSRQLQRDELSQSRRYPREGFTFRGETLESTQTRMCPALLVLACLPSSGARDTLETRISSAARTEVGALPCLTDVARTVAAILQ